MLALARNILGFIFATGQRHHFEEFTENSTERAGPASQGSPELHTRLREAEVFFENLLKTQGLAGEQAPLQAILQAIRFAASTHQEEALEEYLEHGESNAPPFVVAAFETLKEAEDWLKEHPHPPDPANVLIAGAYHDVVHDRETNLRRLPRNRDLQDYLAELAQVEPPKAVASFATLEEAKTWLERRAEPARKQWVSIGGKFYLAAYYPNIRYRALYPLSLIERHSSSKGISQEG